MAGKGAEQLSLSMDDVVLDFCRRAGKRWRQILCDVVAQSGEKQGAVIAAELGKDPGQFSRELNGRGLHLDVESLPNILRRDPDRRFARAVAEFAGGTWQPRRALTDRERVERLEKALQAKGLGCVIDEAYGDETT